MKKNLILLFTTALLIASCTKEGTIVPSGEKQLKASPVGDVVGKVTVGYQGWFSAAGDGSPVNAWGHQNLECWPDVREYATTYSGSPFMQNGVQQSPYTGNLGNGQPAKMFSSYDQSTVNKHFEWMQTYGIDCAALQRFGSELGNAALKAQRDGMANKVQSAAQTYGRKFYIMYDISGWTNFQSEIKTDWTNVMKAHTSSSAYAKQNGKPVVCVWGFGFGDRPGNNASWLDVVNWFKGQGCYVIGGVPSNFQNDATNRPCFIACNMLMPWRVGVTSNFQTMDTNELNFCNANNVDYQTAAYAGTAFYNTNGGAISPKNQIPRNHGDFMWSQFAAAKNANVQSIYISMFDELNEATQIMKTAENSSQIPAGKYFLTLDADGVVCSSDFYLRLSNDGVKMIKGQIPYQATHPTPHTITTSGVTFYQDTNYGGAASQALGVGTYTLSQLAAKGMPNDWASSVRIPSGRTVIMYSDDNFTGTSWTLTSDTPNFPGLSPNANDMVSSVKVQ